MKFWDLATGKETRQVKAPEGTTVSAVAFSKDGKYLAFGANEAVHLCQADTGKEIRQLKAPTGVAGLVFAPDGKVLAIRGRNQRIRLCETETGKELHKLGDAEQPQTDGFAFLLGDDQFSGEARALAFSPDGKQFAAAAGHTVRLWETATGKELPLLGGHRSAPTMMTLSADGKTAVSWGADRVLRRWDASTGKSLGAFPAPPNTALAALSADGSSVALASADNLIRIHETTTGKELRQIKPGAGVSALAFTPDGKTLAVRGGDNNLRLFDVSKGAEVGQIALRAP